MTTAPYRPVDADEAARIQAGLHGWAVRTLESLYAARSEIAHRAAALRAEVAGLASNGPSSGIMGDLVVLSSPAESAEFTAVCQLGAAVAAVDGDFQRAEDLRRSLERTAEETDPSRRRGLEREAINRGLELRGWFQDTDLDERLAFCRQRLVEPGGDFDDYSAGAAVALGLPAPVGRPAIVAAKDLSAIVSTRALAIESDTIREDHIRAIKAGYQGLVERRIATKLSELDLDVLRQATPGGIRIASLEAAGITTVLGVWQNRHQLATVPGIGADSARELQLAASRLRSAVKDDLGRRLVRIDLRPDDRVLTDLLRRLIAVIELDERIEPSRSFLAKVSQTLGDWTPAQPDAELWLLHRFSPRRALDVARYLASTAEEARQLGLTAIAVANHDSDTVWATFRQRSSELYSLLGEIVGIAVDQDAVQGHVSQEIAARVNEQVLRTDQLRTSLRGYQAFGAKFALVQRKVILGDEMGLGKTIQALATMAHLADGGATHFLVVCPNGVLINWIQEIRRHTRLTPYRVHGTDRDAEHARWRSRGGVAVTTYGTLSNLTWKGNYELGLFVADEAHQLKNASTLRARAAAQLIQRSSRSMLMTGTPIENRVEEFSTLVRYLQPEVADRLNDVEVLIGAEAFRQVSSPVYLRRRSDDVLTELPDLVITDDWVALTAEEDEAYLDALADKHFAQLRRVAFVGASKVEESSKISRVMELVAEATANGKRVLVFSYFRDVLQRLADALGDVSVGTITGSLTPEARQGLVDRLAESSSPKALLAQIEAGGQGLNIQSASVVVLCEPQVKPSLEDQAIKRAHRMGQIEKVVVHRILTPDSVDERLLEILDRKRTLIREYVNVSEVAEATPEAKDMSDQEIARVVLAEERKRRSAALRAREGRPTQAEPAAKAPAVQAAKPGSSGPRSLKASPQKPPPRAAPPTVVRQPETSQYQPDICRSCDRPISITGHCGCS